MEYELTTPLGDLSFLNAGDRVYLSGVIYTARDAAHKRMADCLDRGESLPFPLKGNVIFYVGPTPAPEGRAIGSAGPTTSYRMDAFTPRLHRLGLAATIGKGRRSKEVSEALAECGAVHFGATGGAAALLSRHIVKAEVIAWADLGTEAVRRLEVDRLPLIVLADSHGKEAFAEICAPNA